ncbi:MAG TPA: PP2C family protein-serine/threonine phosphatase, partial [Thermoanaerobaculia bacterium]|nr:PP2C family protein-serine/threonine phosphatase [Thermoanaerobaculia bacterium]
MPIFQDWAELGRATIRSLKREDVRGLSLEWKEARRKLVSEHSDQIEGERKRWKRWLRTANAVVFGLTRRLQPTRRLVFALALVVFLLGFSVHVSRQRWEIYIGGGGLVAFLLMMLLLALELVDKIQFRDELVLARELQAELIPKNLPADGAFELGAYNRIANMVGGDVYDFVPLPDGRLAVLFGDASGHGMAAGLVMAVAHAGFRTQVDADPSAAAVIPTLNRLLCRAGARRSFFSCAYLLVSADGSFSVTVAGHPQVLKIDSRGAIRGRFGQGSYPLGIKPTLSWQAETGALAPGEALLLHSDGLVEARNGQDVEFGEERLEGVIRLHAGDSASSLTKALAAELSRFCGPVAPEDDVSIAVIKRRATTGS